MTQQGLPLNDGHVCHVERDADDNPTTRPTPCGHIICRRFVGRWKATTKDDDDRRKNVCGIIDNIGVWDLDDSVERLRAFARRMRQYRDQDMA